MTTATTSRRRAILAGAATLSALAAPASLAFGRTPDPIFALIEAHQAADDAINVYVKQLGGDDIPSDCTVFNRLQEVAAEAALNLMCDGLPTTLAGVVAVMKYVAAGGPSKGYEWPNLWIDDDGKSIDPVIDMIANAAEAIENILSGNQGAMS